MLQATKVPAQIKKVEAMEVPVKRRSIIESVAPFNAAYSKNKPVAVDDFILLTLHREENVDNKKILSSIIKGLIDSNEDIIFPIHPRTKKRLHEFGLFNKLYQNKKIQILDTVGYFEILELMKNCSFIVTDSGGIQEEGPSLGKPVLVMRDVTERPEAVDAGTVMMVGTSRDKIRDTVELVMTDHAVYEAMSRAHNPYGDGNETKRIIENIK